MTSLNKDNLLAKEGSKRHYLDIPSSKLEMAGWEAIYAKGDADTLIVKMAADCVKVASNTSIVLVGNAMDLVVLLCYADMHSNDMLFQFD